MTAADLAGWPGPVAHLADVEVRRGRRTVLHGIDLEIAAGETVVVLGPNGAGKSTLLQTLGGILPPASGGIGMVGRSATVLQDAGLARRSVRANVELALAWWGVPRRERRARADAALDLLRAGHLARRPAGALSGGERRRVHLARGLAVRPELLLLDEPFAGLDPDAHDRLTLDLATALREAGTAVVVVVHERRDAWALADRIGVLLDGRLAALATPDELEVAPPTEEVARFLGFTGEVRLPDGLLLAREIDLALVPHADRRPDDLDARVEQVLRREHGRRVRVAGESCSAWVETAANVAVGEEVVVRIVGGARFPAPTIRP